MTTTAATPAAAPAPPSVLLFDLHASARYHSFDRQDPSGQKCQYRQRGEAWQRMRQRCVTGSRTIGVLMLFGFAQCLQNWYEAYDPDSPVLAALLANRDPREVVQQEECMAWGTYHEIDATASLLYHLGDVLDISVYETTLIPIRLTERSQLIALVQSALASLYKHTWCKDKDEEMWNECLRDTPDGYGREHRTGRKFVIENKAAYGLRAPKAYEAAKWYYYPQMQLHLQTDTDLEYCLLNSWSPSITRIWRVNKDMEFWNLAMPFVVSWHRMGLNKTPPTEQTVLEPHRVQRLIRHCQAKCRAAVLVGEFPSVYSRHRADQLEEMEKTRWRPTTAAPVGMVGGGGVV
jgi:hypothetical protein